MEGKGEANLVSRGWRYARAVAVQKEKGRTLCRGREDLHCGFRKGQVAGKITSATSKKTKDGGNGLRDIHREKKKKRKKRDGISRVRGVSLAQGGGGGGKEGGSFQRRDDEEKERQDCE